MQIRVFAVTLALGVGQMFTDAVKDTGDCSSCGQLHKDSAAAHAEAGCTLRQQRAGAIRQDRMEWVIANDPLVHACSCCGRFTLQEHACEAC